MDLGPKPLGTKDGGFQAAVLGSTGLDAASTSIQIGFIDTMSMTLGRPPPKISRAEKS